jgi:hypothetical protein
LIVFGPGIVLPLIDWPALMRRRRRPDLVTIVVPVYENPRLTHECLLTLRGQPAGMAFEVICVDNGSAELTRSVLAAWARQWPVMRVLSLEKNLHFATGCNLGFEQARGNRVVFLNNDTRVTPGWLAALVAPLNRRSIVAVQPRLLYPNGTVQCAGIVFSRHFHLGYPLFSGMPATTTFVNTARHMQAVTAACMAVRARDFARVQGFDPIFVNGQEDVDLCLRLRGLQPLESGGTRSSAEGSSRVAKTKARWCHYEPASTVYHHEGRAPGRWQHLQPNRLHFVQRWRGRIPPDDEEIHAACGLRIERYLPDHPEHVRLGIGVGRPVLIQA